MNETPAVKTSPIPAMGSRSPWLILTVLCASVFIIVVDGTIVNVALPTFVRELGATTSQLQWIVDAYVLVFAGLLMAAGSIGDRFGRKGTLMIGMTVFGATSIVAALATTPTQLIAWRAAMGIGAALDLPGHARAVGERVHRRSPTGDRHLDLGSDEWFGSRTGAGHRWVPARALLLGVRVPGERAGDRRRDDRDLEGRADIARPTPSAASIRSGSRCRIAGVTLLVWAVIEGPKHGWTSPTTLVAFGLAAALLTAFIRWERRIDHPMLDVGVFTNMRFTAGSVSVAFAFFALFGFIFMVTQYFQFVRGYGTLEAGVRTVPFAIFTGMAAPLSAKLAERFGTKAVVAAGLAMMAVGFAWTTRNTATSSYWLVVGQMFFMGGGLGSGQRSCHRSDHGCAAAGQGRRRIGGQRHGT